MPTHQPIIDAKDRVPLLHKTCYGAGSLCGQFAGGVTAGMFNPVFNIALGISPIVIGTVLMVYRLWDAVADLVMGNISDNTRTRWGRRRPYIVIGSVLTGILLPFLWQASATWSPTTIIVYMIVVGLLLHTAISIWGMPYYSLGMELTPDYNERTRVTAFRAIFEKIAGLAAGWMLTLAALPWFANPNTGEPDLANGMRYLSWVLGALTILIGVLPGLFVRERFYAKDASQQPRIGLWTSLRATLTCRPFMLLMAAYLLQVVGSSMVSSLGLYLNIYYVNSGDIQKAAIIGGYKSTAMFIPGLLSVPLWAWAAEKLGKGRALSLTIVLGFAGNLLIYICYTPEHPYWQIIPSVFLSAFGSAIWMLVPSMQADIADYDELHTGERREGSFSSVSSWFFKLATTVTTGISGIILALTGFDVVKYGKAQPPEVLERMLSWYAFLPMTCWILALFFLARYPLTHKVMADIRSQLEARRGKL